MSKVKLIADQLIAKLMMDCGSWVFLWADMGFSRALSGCPLSVSPARPAEMNHCKIGRFLLLQSCSIYIKIN